MAGHSDPEWVRGIKQAEPKILDDLWDFIYPRCKALANRYKEDEQCASDVAGEVYKRVIAKVGQYAFQCPFWGWCNTIISREMNRWLVRNQRNVARQIPIEDAHELIGNDSSETLQANSETLRSRIQPCLDALSERYRSIINSIYFEWMSPEEVAMETGLERGNVNVIALRARQALLKCLTQRGFGSLEDLLSW